MNKLTKQEMDDLKADFVAGVVAVILAGIVVTVILAANSYEEHEDPCEYRVPEQKRVCK